MATASPEQEPDPQPTRRLWWAVPTSVFVLLILIGLIFGESSEAMPGGTSHDPTDEGYRAVYLLLEGLEFPAERSRQATGGAVRWLLKPKADKEKEVQRLADWVRRGGVVLLSGGDDGFAKALGLSTTRRTLEEDAEVGAEGGDVKELELGTTALDCSTRGGRPWEGVRLEDGPLVTIYSLERGVVWFLHYPEMLNNKHLRRADNAVLACRLAEAMLQGRTGPLAFDEFYHGLRDRPDVFELLWRPPMRTVTAQALVLAALLLWHFAPRFGTVRPLPVPNRRSKEEFLDAMASLLHSKGDFAEAYRTVRADLLRRIEADLGLAPGAPMQDVLREASRRRGVRPEVLQRAFAAPAPPGDGSAAFLKALHQLESASDEYFHRTAAPA